MIKERNSLLLSLIIAILISSCNSIHIEVIGADKVREWKKVGLLQVMISPPRTTANTLFDEAIYYGRFNSIFPEITAIHDQFSNKIINDFGNMLCDYAKTEVLYGESLFDLLTDEQIKKNKINVYPPSIQNDDFPKISFPDYTRNFVDMRMCSIPEEAFQWGSFRNGKIQISKICEVLQVDGIVISTISVNTTAVHYLGFIGDRTLFIRLFYFNKDGELDCVGIISSKYTTSGPDNLKEYIAKLMEYPKHLKYLLATIYLDKSPEK